MENEEVPWYGWVAMSLILLFAASGVFTAIHWGYHYATIPEESKYTVLQPEEYNPMSDRISALESEILKMKCEKEGGTYYRGSGLDYFAYDETNKVYLPTETSCYLSQRFYKVDGLNWKLTEEKTF